VKSGIAHCGKVLFRLPPHMVAQPGALAAIANGSLRSTQFVYALIGIAQGAISSGAKNFDATTSAHAPPKEQLQQLDVQLRSSAAGRAFALAMDTWRDLQASS